MKTVMLTDNQLIASYQSGDESALKALIARYEKRLFSYIMLSVKNKELAEDIFQDTFIKVINTIRSGNYHEEGKFFQWVMRIANNLKIDYYRKVQRMPVFEGNGEYDIFDILGSREDSVEQGAHNAYLPGLQLQGDCGSHWREHQHCPRQNALRPHQPAQNH